MTTEIELARGEAVEIGGVTVRLDRTKGGRVARLRLDGPPEATIDRGECHRDETKRRSEAEWLRWAEGGSRA